MSQHNGGSMLVGLLLGAVVGGGLAMLFAPLAGEETRRRIRDSARQLRDNAVDRVDDVEMLIVDRLDDVGAALDAGMEAFHHDTGSGQTVHDRI